MRRNLLDLERFENMELKLLIDYIGKLTKEDIKVTMKSGCAMQTFNLIQELFTVLDNEKNNRKIQ